ncbi:hypothetical protein [Lentzea albidocapillata]|uniref:hypothetical protein n=1 Tax=Lentzea albidocapillata TaxID=40571 RepID=UPI0012FA7005|nr:hypothetical protein [Lentzea albidocapillata]
MRSDVIDRSSSPPESAVRCDDHSYDVPYRAHASHRRRMPGIHRLNESRERI